MKVKLTLLIVFVASFFMCFAQQPPNGGFENFTGPFSPVGWVGLEDIVGTFLPFQNSVFTFQDTTTYTQGRASIKLISDTVPVYSQQLSLGTFPGVVSLGSGTLNVQSRSVSFSGIPFTYRPDSLIFDYKLTSPGIDTGGVHMVLSRQASVVLQGADYLLPDSNWVHMALSLTGLYSNNNIPDTLLIQFVASYGNNAVIGTTLHVDGVRFGYINPPVPANVTAAGPLTFCAGDSIIFQANTGTGYTYQWSKNGSIISGATGSSYTAYSQGSYTVQIDSGSSVAYSVPQAVEINHPQASLTGLNDTVCSNAGAISLNGSPANGTYAGNGVSGSTFTPSAANLGIDTIQYTATDANHCTGTAVATVFVENCDGINNIVADRFSVYPNPASSILNITSNAVISGLNLQIFDAVGRLVLSQALTGPENAIDVAKLTNGIYVYRITEKDNTILSQNKFNVVK